MRLQCNYGVRMTLAEFPSVLIIRWSSSLLEVYPPSFPVWKNGPCPISVPRLRKQPSVAFINWDVVALATMRQTRRVTRTTARVRDSSFFRYLCFRTCLGDADWKRTFPDQISQSGWSGQWNTKHERKICCCLEKWEFCIVGFSVMKLRFSGGLLRWSKDLFSLGSLWSWRIRKRA